MNSTWRAVAVSLSLLIAGLAAAEEPDLTAVFESLEAVMDTAREIESYAMLHGRLPKAASPAELSTAIVGSDSRAAEMVDGWGTPLIVESDPARKEYTVASAGSDRTFNRAEWAQRAETQDTAADIVIRNRELVRWPETWAVARLHASAGEPDSSPASALERNHALRTIADMMVLQTAIVAYADDHGGALPAATEIAVLASLLEPKYGAKIPRTDAWGNTFGVMINSDANMYRIVAAGADQKFEVAGWEDTETVGDYARDLVLFNGDFVGPWETGAVPGAAGQALTSLGGAKNMWKAMLEMSAEDRRRQRLQGLKWDTEDATRKADVVAAIGLYEEYQREDPAFHDSSLLWPLEFAFTSPPPASLGRPRATDDPAQAAAIPRIEAALRRTAKANPDDFVAVFSLSKLATLRGDSAAARAFLSTFAERHPNEINPWFELAKLSMEAKDWAAATRDFEQIAAKALVSEDVKTLGGAADFAMLIASNVPGDAMLASRRTAVIEKGVAVARRVLAGNPDDAGAMFWLSNLLRQQASLEKDAAKKAKLTEEADSLSAKALAPMKEDAKPREKE